jgi:hypothetical protein
MALRVSSIQDADIACDFFESADQMFVSCNLNNLEDTKPNTFQFTQGSLPKDRSNISERAVSTAMQQQCLALYPLLRVGPRAGEVAHSAGLFWVNLGCERALP